MPKTLDFKIPPLSADLIIAVDKIYPALVARPGASMDDIMFNAGQRDVINFLTRKLKEAEDNILDEED